MRYLGLAFIVLLPFVISSCASRSSYQHRSMNSYQAAYNPGDYSSRLPQKIDTKEKVVLVDPNIHAWGAYENGELVKGGIATAGGNWCDDINRPCKTRTGSFRIQRIGSSDCRSSLYPRPHGGGLMPYCMFFSGGMALHGSPAGAVVADNISHGCVRMRIPDAEWVRNNFARVGTKVIVKPY